MFQTCMTFFLLWNINDDYDNDIALYCQKCFLQNMQDVYNNQHPLNNIHTGKKHILHYTPLNIIEDIMKTWGWQNESFLFWVNF